MLSFDARAIFVSALCATALSLVACASDTTDPVPSGEDDASEEADIKAGKVVGENELCGSDVAIQKRCKKGLICARRLGGPISEHTPGICKKAPTGACASKTNLPACPERCIEGEGPGKPCYAGKVCGNSIGDTCTCAAPSFTFNCTVHAPLGPGCNLTCLP